VFEFVYKNILIVYIKMFYIISSRIPIISSDKTNRKYFKLFVSGAVSYVLLHYYLNKEVRSGMVEKIRKYIYYVMCIDFAIACVLLKYIKTNVPNTDENDEEDNEDNENKENKKNNSNINNQQKLSRELEEQRRLFLEEHQRKLLQEKMLQQKAQALALAQAQEQEKKNKVKTESEKTESEKTESEKTKSEKTESEKSQKKTEKKKEKKVEKKKEKKVKDETDEKTNVTDTEIPLPIYNN